MATQFCFSFFQQLFRGNSVAEFEMKWRHWKDDCERRLEEGEFATNRNLEIIARVLEIHINHLEILPSSFSIDLDQYTNKYSRTSMAQTSLGPWKFVLDMKGSCQFLAKECAQY